MEFIDVKLTGPNTEFLTNIPKYIKGEYIFSYLGRLGNANGFANTIDFISALIERKFPFSCKHMAFILKIFELHNCSILDGGLISNILFPFVTEKDIDFIYRFYEAKNNRKNIAEYEPLRICPECFKEDMKRGFFYYRTFHQLPGVSHCADHGCKLLEYRGDIGEEFKNPSFFKIDMDDYPLATSTFMKDMSLNPVVCNKYETAYALKRRFKELWPASNYTTIYNRICKALPFWDKSEIERSIQVMLSSREIPFSDHVFVANLLAYCFESYDQFRTYALEFRDTYNLIIQDAVKNDYIIECYNQNGSITFVCKHCGHKFDITPDALFSGHGCEFCGKALDTKRVSEKNKVIDSAISNIISLPDDYKIINLTDGILTVLHRPSGRVSFNIALEFMTNPTIPKGTYEVDRVTIDNISDTFDETRKAKEVLFYDDNHHRIGVPVCDTLLNDIGLIHTPGECPSVAVFDDKYFNEHIHREFKGYNCDVFFMKGSPDSKHWLALAFVITLRYSSYCSYWKSTRSYELAYWMKHNGVTSELLRDKNMMSFDAVNSKYAAELIEKV